MASRVVCDGAARLAGHDDGVDSRSRYFGSKPFSFDRSRPSVPGVGRGDVQMTVGWYCLQHEDAGGRTAPRPPRWQARPGAARR